jgi:hypothetical protein
VKKEPPFEWTGNANNGHSLVAVHYGHVFRHYGASANRASNGYEDIARVDHGSRQHSVRLSINVESFWTKADFIALKVFSTKKWDTIGYIFLTKCARRRALGYDGAKRPKFC